MQQIFDLVGKLHQDLHKRVLTPDLVNQCIDQILFGFLLESTGYFPEIQFREELLQAGRNPANFGSRLINLFARYEIFFPEEILVFKSVDFLLTPYEIDSIHGLAKLDWTNTDPFILGILAESQLGSDTRVKLGAHFTSQSEIEEITEAVIFKDLRAEWSRLREDHNSLTLAEIFALKLEKMLILDPSCGCGNFLVVCLRKLLDLLHEVNQVTDIPGYDIILSQFYGIEYDERFSYLAYYSLVIARLQYGKFDLENLKTDYPDIRNKDAILDLSNSLCPQETIWPNVDYIIGNPPYLGVFKLRQFLGESYCETLQYIYENRVPAGADLCCYWIEKARDMIDRSSQLKDNKTPVLKAVGFVLPYGVKQGASRLILERVADSCRIFYAKVNKDWEGLDAHVKVCFFGFGPDGYPGDLFLNDKKVGYINPDLLEDHKIYKENQTYNKLCDCFMGIDDQNKYIVDPNILNLSFEKSHSDPVNGPFLRPYKNGLSLVRENGWNPEWITYDHGRFTGVTSSRCIVTPRVSKHCVFSFLDSVYVVSNGVFVFDTEDYLAFGVLQSKVYETWTLGNCGWRNESRQFRKVTCFDSFTFPDLDSNPKLAQEIRDKALELDQLRNKWLYPEHLFKKDSWSFLTTNQGVWKHHIKGSVSNNPEVSLVKFPRLVPVNSLAEKIVSKLVLTDLYNTMPEWLENAHKELDRLVYQAYGWDESITTPEILKKLQELRDLA